MPLYEYAPNAGRCTQCNGRFEVLQSLSAGPLTKCPQCEEPCHRVLSGFATGKSTANVMSTKNLEQKGFTRYEKTGDGSYTKTLGDGPAHLNPGGKEE
jgi:putative FmdB family regulatory protein